MHSIQWTDEFAIGIGEIDDQHRQLVEMINALETNKNSDEAAANGLLLRQLNDYVRDHFALEERLMVKGRCDKEFMERHCGEHAYFRGALKDFTADFEGGRNDVNASLIEYLVHWLLHHIVVIDRDMAAQLHVAVPHLEAEVAAMAKHFTEDLTEAERHLITDLQHSNTELLRLLKQADTKAVISAPQSGGMAPQAVLRPDADSHRSDRWGASEAMLLLADARAEWLDPAMLRRLSDAMGARSPGLRAEVLSTGIGSPDELAGRVEALVSGGVTQIVVVPVLPILSVSAGEALARELDECRMRHPTLRLSLANSIAGSEVVVAALVEAAFLAR